MPCKNTDAVLVVRVVSTALLVSVRWSDRIAHHVFSPKFSFPYPNISADVHDHLEKHLAKFFGTEEAILYPSAYATMSSIIPTFAARADLLVV